MKPRQWTRRSLLAAGAAGAVAGPAACAEGEGSVQRSASLWIEHFRQRLALRRVRGLPLEEAIPGFFSYLELDPEGVARFANAWREVEPRGRVTTHALSAYLLSTDFFLNGADESQVLRFVTLYDPFGSPCYDPIRIADARERA